MRESLASVNCTGLETRACFMPEHLYLPSADNANPRTEAALARLRKAMADIEADIAAHQGVYPFNHGRVTQSELCRRADVKKATLQTPLHKDTTRVQILDWLDTLAAGLTLTRDATREKVTAVADTLAEEVTRCICLESLSAHSRYAPEAFVSGREVFRDPCLGTPGGGNHFVELQVVDKVLDRHAAYAHGLKAGDVVVMIHSGSRDVGFFVGGRWMDRAREAWPAGVRHPESKLYALAGPLAHEYLQAMGVAARYAWLNRVVLAEMVRREMAKLFGAEKSRLVVDVPHNV
ncbi:MAG: hypothetical protein EAZ54_13255, partial [Curvibacter sp.]